MNSIQFNCVFIRVKQILNYNMLGWIIKFAILSFIFIFLVHHLLTFFKTTLTVPKIKDLVNSPNEKYQHIYDSLQNMESSSTPSYTSIDLLPPSTNSNTNTNTNTNSMKDELKSFLKSQLTSTSSSSSTPISNL